jgi:hypothetical protein
VEITREKWLPKQKGNKKPIHKKDIKIEEENKREKPLL